MTTVTADYPGREEPHRTVSVQDQICSPWQQASGRGQRGRGLCGRSPMWSRNMLSHSPHCPDQALQLCQRWRLQSPKHLCSRLASQQPFTNKSKETTNTSILQVLVLLIPKYWKHRCPASILCSGGSDAEQGAPQWAHKHVTALALKVNRIRTYGWE